MKEETQLWLDYAKEDYRNAQIMWKAHRYAPTAFFCQQTIEKILKAYIVESKNKRPRKSHDLLRLVEDAGLKIPQKWEESLKEMSRHYFQVRYPDLDRKYYSRREDVWKILSQMEEIYQWVLKKFNR